MLVETRMLVPNQPPLPSVREGSSLSCLVFAVAFYALSSLTAHRNMKTRAALTLLNFTMSAILMVFVEVLLTRKEGR